MSTIDDNLQAKRHLIQFLEMTNWADQDIEPDFDISQGVDYSILIRVKSPSVERMLRSWNRPSLKRYNKSGGC